MSVNPIKMDKIYFEQDKVSKKVVKKTPKVETVYQKPVGNGNLDVNMLLNKLLNKMDNLSVNNQVKVDDVYGDKNIGAIDIDIKREISIDKVDKNAVKSQVFEGKVNNKLEKLRRLKQRNK